MKYRDQFGGFTDGPLPSAKRTRGPDIRKRSKTRRTGRHVVLWRDNSTRPDWLAFTPSHKTRTLALTQMLEHEAADHMAGRLGVEYFIVEVPE